MSGISECDVAPAGADGCRPILMLVPHDPYVDPRVQWVIDLCRRAARTEVLSFVNDCDGPAVTDDGVGFPADERRRGTGIQGMRDRMAVFGGDAEVDSTPGEGTIVRGRIPIAQGVPA